MTQYSEVQTRIGGNLVPRSLWDEAESEISPQRSGYEISLVVEC